MSHFGNNSLPSDSAAPSTSRFAPSAKPSGTTYVPSTKKNINWPGIGVGVVIVIIIASAIISSAGKTSADKIAVGDCFASPNASFSEVIDQDCSGPHDVQAFAASYRVGSFSTTSGLSAASEQTSKCEQALIEIILSDHVIGNDAIVLPDDIGLAEISTSGSYAGGEMLCVIDSPSGGLVGSLLP